MRREYEVLKGRIIVGTREDRYGNATLVLDDGSTIDSSDGGFGVELMHCMECDAKLTLEERENRSNRCNDCQQMYRDALSVVIAAQAAERRAEVMRLALTDSPQLAKIRAEFQ